MIYSTAKQGTRRRMSGGIFPLRASANFGQKCVFIYCSFSKWCAICYWVQEVGVQTSLLAEDGREASSNVRKIFKMRKIFGAEGYPSDLRATSALQGQYYSLTHEPLQDEGYATSDVSLTSNGHSMYRNGIYEAAISPATRLDAKALR